MNDLTINERIFESIKHIDKNGCEFWYARELQKVLDYKRWDKFSNVIDNAKMACNLSNNEERYHFSQLGKMVDIGSNTTRKIDDYKLTRYACYLIAQNGDSRKKVIALAQTYFAIQTRKQELLEKSYNELSEIEKRFYNRDLTKKANYSLNQIASKAGVRNFGEFHNAGYKGLYGGETANDIFNRKKLSYREDILDNMCSSELIANLFRIDQTNQKLINENVKGQTNANNTHFQVGKKVRDTIKDLGGTMPEDLPTPEKSLKELEKENNLIKN